MLFQGKAHYHWPKSSTWKSSRGEIDSQCSLQLCTVKGFSPWSCKGAIIVKPVWTLCCLPLNLGIPNILSVTWPAISIEHSTPIMSFIISIATQGWLAVVKAMTFYDCHEQEQISLHWLASERIDKNHLIIDCVHQSALCMWHCAVPVVLDEVLYSLGDALDLDCCLKERTPKKINKEIGPNLQDAW